MGLSEIHIVRSFALMDYVDLLRNFVVWSKDAEPKLDAGRSGGRHYGGWLDWANLIEHQRVVLLAEAASGKSEEFKHAAASLREKGSPAFYATIESLVDARFPSDLTSRSLFERWKVGSETAWFFLDSVDEARLNRKRFEDALDRLSESLGPALPRARVLV